MSVTGKKTEKLKVLLFTQQHLFLFIGFSVGKSHPYDMTHYLGGVSLIRFRNPTRPFCIKKKPPEATFLYILSVKLTAAKAATAPSATAVATCLILLLLQSPATKIPFCAFSGRQLSSALM